MPLSGPESGGTLIKLTGANYRDVPTLRCRFDDKVVDAEYVSDAEVHCHSPPRTLLRNLTIAKEESMIYTCRWERL